IADNYISRIVGPRQLGEKLLFLGGVALNKSVALAIAARSQRKVIVPTHPELMGAVGTALMTRDLLRTNINSEENYKLKNLMKGEIQVKNTFRCKACENNCDIQNISIRGKVYPFGGLCSKYKLLRQKKTKVKEGQDLIELRNNLIFNEFGARPVKNPRGTIGIPMALTSHILFPLYAKFINELGYDVIVSNPSKIGNTKTKAPICYPCELAHGAINDLINRNVDYIFLPHVIEMEIPKGYIHGYTCPSTTTIPDIIRAAFENGSEKILSPHIGLSEPLIETTLKEFGRTASFLGLESKVGINAGFVALSHYKTFKEIYYQFGKKKIKDLLKKPSVIIAGRPYVVYPPDVNIALPRKIVSRGYNAIPSDLLPMLDSEATHKRNVWSFTQEVNNAVEYVKKYPNLYICFVSCFSCGPDGTMYHLFRQKLEGDTFCYLEIDSHTAHAGFETRVGAFLDIIEERHRKNDKDINILINQNIAV
ncbi:MAG: acyl-CoA dehydratase activase-related protein, partial [Candidatus Hermodarchaeota archaeon]